MSIHHQRERIDTLQEQILQNLPREPEADRVWLGSILPLEVS